MFTQLRNYLRLIQQLVDKVLPLDNVAVLEVESSMSHMMNPVHKEAVVKTNIFAAAWLICYTSTTNLLFSKINTKYVTMDLTCYHQK